MDSTIGDMAYVSVMLALFSSITTVFVNLVFIGLNGELSEGQKIRIRLPVAVTIGVALCLASGVDIFDLTPYDWQVPYASTVVTGFIIGLGDKILIEAVELLTASRKHVTKEIRYVYDETKRTTNSAVPDTDEERTDT